LQCVGYSILNLTAKVLNIYQKLNSIYLTPFYNKKKKYPFKPFFDENRPIFIKRQHKNLQILISNQLSDSGNF